MIINVLKLMGVFVLPSPRFSRDLGCRLQRGQSVHLLAIINVLKLMEVFVLPSPSFSRDLGCRLQRRQSAYLLAITIIIVLKLRGIFNLPRQ